MSDLLRTLPETCAGQIAAILPELREARGIAGRFNLERLKAKMILAPAVLISIVGMRQLDGAAGPQHRWGLDMAAFIVTTDRTGLDRDMAAATLTQAIAAFVPDRRWGIGACGPAESVEGRPLITRATERAAASLWAVSWRQPCTFTPLPATEPINPALYVGQAPAIGADHEDDYEEIGGQE